MAGHRVSGKADYMMDNRHKTSQSGQILTRQHFLLLVYITREFKFELFTTPLSAHMRAQEIRTLKPTYSRVRPPQEKSKAN